MSPQFEDHTKTKNGASKIKPKITAKNVNEIMANLFLSYTNLVVNIVLLAVQF